MENSEDLDKASGLVGLGTPVKPRQPLKFYVRRKSLNLLNKFQDMDGSATSPKEETKNSEEELGEKCVKSKIPQDDSQYFSGEGKKKNYKRISRSQRFHRPRIMEEGKKPRNPTTTRLRTISTKRKKKKEKDDQEECIVEPRTPEKQSFPKRRKEEATKHTAPTLTFDERIKHTAPTLTFDERIVSTCLELSRSSGPNFLNCRRRMATLPRTDFRVLVSSVPFPTSTWKKQSRRSIRKKNMVRWAGIALSFKCLEETVSLVAIHPKEKDIKKITRKLDLMHSKRQKRSKNPVEHYKVPEQPFEKSKSIDKFSIEEKTHETNNGLPRLDDIPIHKEDIFKTSSSCIPPKQHNKRMKNIVGNLIQQLNYQKEHRLSSLADVPLHIEDTLMRSVSYIAPEQPIRTTTDVVKLIKEMNRLNINKRVTILGKAKKKRVAAKVDLDPDTVKEWEVLMENDLPNRSYADENTESKWKEERGIFQSRIDLFINRMHYLQGNRKFKQWKGSVVDSVVGVFLTQNVSDYLSSNAFMSVAAKFSVDAKESLESLAYFIEEPQEVNESVADDRRPIQNENDDAKSSPRLVSSPENVEEHEQKAKRKNKKTGIIEDEKVDWNSLRKMYTKEGLRDTIYMDTVDWNAVRLSDQQVLADTIMKRGQHNELARKILKFLNNEANQNGIVDLEWLRDAPSDLVKRYLLEIEGIGLKSTECVRLLGLKHSAFPVDTNVGRIAVRLGWVPLEPLPNGVQMHQLFDYPSMDSIQKYLWPRLCKLPQETLYELHYQMITFGKVFCTKVIPNCNACPMKSECKYFASAYVSSKVLLDSPEERTHESDASMPTYSHDVHENISSKINCIEECVSPKCVNETNCCEPMVEFPSSPTAEIPELLDIEDTPCRSPCQSYAKMCETDIDMDTLKKNVVDAFLKGGKLLNSCNDGVSKALAVLTPENACIPMKLPRKTKYYDRLRTEHVVYLLPDKHPLLHDFERREPDDPSPYLLAIWQPGETSYSSIPPTKKCDSDGSKLCGIKSCSYCWTIREKDSNIYRGTILIPCRTAMRAGFPLNGTYFQTNEVFADHETSLEPITFTRELCDGLEKRALYCGSSVTSIFRLLDESRIRLCFWTGFVCMRAFNRKQRNPETLVRRLHTPPDERGEKHMKEE